MSGKPQKRLVSKGQYLWIMGMKTTLYVAATGVVCLGLAGLVLNIYGSWDDVSRTAGSTDLETAIPLGRFTPTDHIYFLVLGAILSVTCLAIIWLGKSMFKKAQRVEPVALLKRQSVIPLPEAETLVRASDLPPSHQQDELLRAAPQGSETPAAELLRATNRQAH